MKTQLKNLVYTNTKKGNISLPSAEVQVSFLLDQSILFRTWKNTEVKKNNTGVDVQHLSNADQVLILALCHFQHF